MHKEDFPIFKSEENSSLVYLDSASTSQIPQSTINVLKNFYEKEKANISRGLYSLSENAEKKFSEAKKTVSELINSYPEEIIFTQNTTSSINQLVYSIDSLFDWNEIKSLKGKNKDFQPEILLTEMEHHSNLVPWQQFAKHLNWKLKFIKINKETFELDIEDAKQKLNKNTYIFSLTHASNVLGNLNPVKELIEIARSKSSKVICIVDAAQSISHLLDEVNVKELDADFLAFSGHKLYSSFGAGVLYGKKELLAKLRPFYFGGGMIKKVELEKTEFADDISQRFEAGTQNVGEVLALAEAINYLKRSGFDKIKNYENELKNYALEKLKEIDGIKIYHPTNSKDSIPVISFSLEDFHPHDVAYFLAEKNICVRAGHHCCMPLMSSLRIEEGLVRVSLAFYNTKEDVDKLVSALVEFKNERFSSNEKRQLIFDLYKNPENFGVINNPSHYYYIYNPLCGDEITMQLRFGDDFLEDIKFNGKGCAISMASASLLTDLIKTKKLSKEEISKLKKDDVLDLLGIPISSVRIKCALLPLEAVQKALENGTN